MSRNREDKRTDEVIELLIESIEMLRREVHRQGHQIRFILRELGHPDTLHVTLTTGATMNLGQQQTALVSETNSVSGQVFPVTGTTGIVYSIDNTAVATVSPNPDGTATVTAVAVGTATLTASDPTNKLSGTVAVTVTAATTGQPDTLTVTLSAPFAAGTSGNTGAVAAATLKSGAKLV
jgi:hypothetical protein